MSVVIYHPHHPFNKEEQAEDGFEEESDIELVVELPVQPETGSAILSQAGELRTQFDTRLVTKNGRSTG